MLVLPDFELGKRQPKVPHVSRVIARNVVPNEHGAPIEYTVRQSRNGRDWWISASLHGMRHSNTLHTAKPELGAAWVRAVESGQIDIERDKRTPAELDRDIEEALARLRAKRATR